MIATHMEETKPKSKTKREYIPGEGYRAVEPRPLVFISEQGPKGSRGNAPYVRSEPKRLSKKAKRYAAR